MEPPKPDSASSTKPTFRPDFTEPDFTEEEQELRQLLGTKGGTCPPLDVLLALKQEVLPAEVEAAATRHVERCPLCQQLLADLELEGLGTQRRDAPMTTAESQRVHTRIAIMPSSNPQSSRSQARAWAATAAVAAILIIGAGSFTAWQWNRTPSPTPGIAVEQPLSVSPTTPVALEAQLQIPFAPLAPPSEGPKLATRGAGSAEPSVEALLPAFRAYNRADFAHAAKEFSKLQHDYPHSAQAALYLGVTELALNDDASAVTNLQLALDHLPAPAGTDPEAARWYLAIAKNRLHDPSAARLLLRTVCQDKNSSYASRSCELIAPASH